MGEGGWYDVGPLQLVCRLSLRIYYIGKLVHEGVSVVS